MLEYITVANVMAVAYLVLLEGILSVDNALALAALVHGRLPNPEDQKKALRYGIWGAYVFRTIVIFFGVWFMSHAWVKGLAGGYLIYLGVSELFFKKGLNEGESEVGGFKFKWLTPLWSCILSVELMDIMFSIDSIAVALTVSDKAYVLIAGAFLGILAMRFAAQAFIGLIKKFPILEHVAFVLVLMAGIKICVELFDVHVPEVGFMAGMFAVIGGSMVYQYLNPPPRVTVNGKYVEVKGMGKK